ncbi:hypothetical protein [Streptomyces sp. NPDC058108]|uniref:hypothetical protein n=1 Tax=Streptomyces sp. NPDC058108 TaxID=3346344 RepID=UPI0036ED2514
MNASTHEVRATRTATPVLVLAIEPVPGLRVYEEPEELRHPDGAAYPWRLGHHSGLAMAAFASRDDAVNAAHQVAGFADWTRPADELRADAGFDLTGYCDRLMETTTGLIIAA